MRVIAFRSIKEFYEKHPASKSALQAWYQEAKKAKWKNTNELKSQYKNASIIGDKRVVFNIKGNNYRLIVEIEFDFQIVFIRFIGTHKAYDNIDAKTI